MRYPAASLEWARAAAQAGQRYMRAPTPDEELAMAREIYAAGLIDLEAFEKNVGSILEREASLKDTP